VDPLLGDSWTRCELIAKRNKPDYKEIIFNDIKYIVVFII